MKSKIKLFLGHTATFSAGVSALGIPILVKYTMEKNSVGSVKLMSESNDLNDWLWRVSENNEFINFGFGEDDSHDFTCDSNFEKYEIHSKGNEEISYDVCISKGKTYEDIKGVLGEQFKDFKKLS